MCLLGFPRGFVTVQLGLFGSGMVWGYCKYDKLALELTKEATAEFLYSLATTMYAAHYNSFFLRNK